MRFSVEADIRRAGQAVIVWLSHYFKSLLVVMNRHRRRHLPLRRTRTPDVTGGWFPMFDAAEEVIEENQHRGGDQERGNGNQKVPEVKTERRIVVSDASLHPQQPTRIIRKVMTRKEGKSSQKCNFPSFSLIRRPVALGNQ